MDLRESEILGDTIGAHWYYRSKARAVRRLLGNETVHRILDVGAGSGFFSRYLLEKTAAEVAVCVDTSYPQDADTIVDGHKRLLKRRSVDRSDADLVLMMDVLEHVDDDASLLARYVEMSPRGSRFVITVPAFEWLWSSHDDFLGHRRRYTVKRLERLVRGVRLEVDVCHYFFGLVLPLALPGRLVEHLRPPARPPRSSLATHHPFTNAVLEATSVLELPWMRVNRLAGLSVVCLAHKAT